MKMLRNVYDSFLQTTPILPPETVSIIDEKNGAVSTCGIFWCK